MPVSKVVRRCQRRRAGGRLAVATVGVAVLGTLAACGSTVQLAASGANSEAGEQEQLSLGATSAPPVSPTTGVSASGAPSTSANAVQTAPGQGRLTPTGGAPGSSSAGAGSPSETTVNGSNGPGVTSSTINIGISYISNSAASQEAFGAGGVKIANGKTQAEAIVADINAHGGVAGRKLNAIYFAYNSDSNVPESEQQQQACAFYTQDHHDFFILDSGLDLIACAQHAGATVGGVPNLVGPGDGMSQSQFDQFPYYFDAAYPSLDRIEADLVRTLSAEHYFGDWNAGGCSGLSKSDKVGIIAPDQPQYVSTVQHTLLPALAAHGVHVSSNDIFYYPVASGISDATHTVASLASAELRFCSDHVNHVIPLDIDGLAFFAVAANLQHYTPRLGLNSGTGADAYAGVLIPYDALNGAVGLGWAPTLDLKPSLSNAKAYATPEKHRCLHVISAAGSPPQGAAAETQALAYCSVLYTLQRVLDHVPSGVAINQQSYLNALNGIGKVPSALLPSSFYGTGRHDGPSEAWEWEYSPSCKCLRYAGRPFPLK